MKNKPTPVLTALASTEAVDWFRWIDGKPYLTEFLEEAIRDHNNYYPDTFVLGDMLAQVWDNATEVCVDCVYYVDRGEHELCSCKVLDTNMWPGMCPAVAARL